MASDSEQQRLELNYAEMSEEQVQKLAASAASLTELAHVTLKKELERRGLAVELNDSTSEDVLEFHKLTTIRKFRDLPEALLAKGSLDSAGMECYLEVAKCSVGPTDSGRLRRGRHRRIPPTSLPEMPIVGYNVRGTE